MREQQNPDQAPRVGYVPGGFDMLHVGHINVLIAARDLCDHLVVGVATDESLKRMKGRLPVIPHVERMRLVEALRIVDEVVPDLDQDKRLAWRNRRFDVLFKGDDWKDTPKGERLEREMKEVGAEVVYLPYTRSTSSTILRCFLAQELGMGPMDDQVIGDHASERSLPL